MIGTIITAVLVGLGGVMLNWLSKRKAENDALRADRAEGAVRGKIESEAAKNEVNDATQKARHDPDPDMSDWT